MLLGTGSACLTHWTSAPCTGDQRRGDQRVPLRHTTMMPHLPRSLHPVLQLVSPGLVWGYHVMRRARSSLIKVQEGIARYLNTLYRRKTALIEFAECATHFRPGSQKAQPLGRRANLTPIFTEARLSKTQAHGIVATRPPYSEKTLWMSRSLFPMIWPTIYRKNGETILPAVLWKAWLLKLTGNG
jgi:hypothetical protein